jgi:hypothetical protein
MVENSKWQREKEKVGGGGEVLREGKEKKNKTLN